ncbi:hypothetical protein B0H17DRAFT_1215198 [Mycena rosella]|uniref:Uncharacterized protein n=1 Tax=Mycena rosella TaxID=1033263 RepID=A0AAD7G3I3_MYCRO|nr:hypothetical protein B0H17DRAFT_1215198 [Mycena rosella]
MTGSSRVRLPSFPSTSTPCQAAAKTKSNLKSREQSEQSPGPLLCVPLLLWSFWYFKRPKQRTKRAPSPYNIYIKEHLPGRGAPWPPAHGWDERAPSWGAAVRADAPESPKRGQPVVIKHAPKAKSRCREKAAVSKKGDSEEIQRSALFVSSPVYPAPAYHDSPTIPLFVPANMRIVARL